jgi:hypothetical protein
MMQKLERYTPPAFISLVFLLSYVCLYFGAMPLFADPDTGWHLATGDLILREGKLPATDPWSFAAAGQPWYIISWLWDVKIELIHRMLGLSGVFFFTILAMAALGALLAYSLTKREYIGSDAMILTLLIMGISLIEYASPRPHIAAYFFIVITHMILHRSRTREHSRALFAIPAMMIAWVNIHGSFLVGLTLLGAYGLEALVARRFAWFKRLFLIGVLCLPMLLLNPYGIEMYTAVMRTLHSVITQYIVEWLPFVFGNSLGLSIAFLVFFCAGPLRERRVPLADKIISLIWLLAMLFSTRNAIIFLLVSAPALALALQSFSDQLVAFRTVRPDPLQPLSAAKLKPRMALAAIALVLGTVWLQPVLRSDILYAPDKDPGAAVAWLKEHAIGKRILNDYEYGGRLIFETRGTVPVFVDGRSGTAYSEQVLGEYIGFMMLLAGWDKIVDAYRIDGIFVENESVFARAYAAGQYRREWKEAYRDGVASIYLRKR